MKYYSFDRPKAFENFLKDNPSVLMKERDASHKKPRALRSLCVLLLQVQVALIGDSLQWPSLVMLLSTERPESMEAR